MQFTDTGSTLHHQHIWASTAERIPGFLQCCRKSRICSVFPRGFTLLLEKQLKPKPPALAEGNLMICSGKTIWQTLPTESGGSGCPAALLLRKLGWKERRARLLYTYLPCNQTYCRCYWLHCTQLYISTLRFCIPCSAYRILYFYWLPFLRKLQIISYPRTFQHTQKCFLSLVPRLHRNFPWANINLDSPRYPFH